MYNDTNTAPDQVRWRINPKGPDAGFDPVLISLIRRAMPNLMAYDICGVQPMSGPTGLIFAMRAMYDGPQGPYEALFNEADVQFANKAGGVDETGAYTYPAGQAGNTAQSQTAGNTYIHCTRWQPTPRARTLLMELCPHLASTDTNNWW